MEFKICLLLIALVGCACAQTPNRKRNRMRECPPSPPVVATCQFNASIHCTGDVMCKSGQKCCPHDCNSICKPVQEPFIGLLTRPPPPGSCPPPSDLVGKCALIKGRDCFRDRQCKRLERCCRDRCGKMCKPVRLSSGSNHLQLSFALMAFAAIATGGYHLL